MQIRTRSRKKFNSWNENKTELCINDKIVRIDPEDYKLVDEYTWRVASGTGYAVSSIWRRGRNPTIVYLHRLVTNAPEDLTIHHKNENKLDNRKCNLDIIPLFVHAQNRKYKNKTGYKGVVIQKQYYKTISGEIRYYGIPHYRASCAGYTLGYFRTAQEAAIAYDKFAEIYYKGQALDNKALGLL